MSNLLAVGSVVPNKKHFTRQHRLLSTNHTCIFAGSCDDEGSMEGVELGTDGALTQHYEAARIDAQVCVYLLLV